ncbi:MAG: DUF1673 family protein [Methanoregula sp.]|nr:DUF1673 family protein [Methanoregula sp.]
MTTRASEVVRGWLGWCPQARTLPRQLPVLNEETHGGAPLQGTGMPARTGRLQRYRNQVLILAVSFTLAAIPFMAFFQTDDLTRLMMYTGIIAGMGFSVFFGRWLWHSLGMLAKGSTIKTGPGEYIIHSLIDGALPTGFVLIIAAVVAIISLAGALAFPAFVTGFAFVPWYVFTLIMLWEWRTGFVLMFDRKARSFTAERGTGYAYR